MATENKSAVNLLTILLYGQLLVIFCKSIKKKQNKNMNYLSIQEI